MKQVIQHLLTHKTLSCEESKQLLKEIAQEKYNQAQITAFITVFMMRKITVAELSGFRDALLELAVPVDFSEFNTIDIVGTGGDSKNTFNISTLSSLIVAGAGYNVAKHGSTGVSSACGSSNVIEYFGYNFTNDNKELKRRMAEHGIVFMHAPLFHPALKAVAPIRKALGLKTIFNMLGPMVNPSKPRNMMLGVSDLEIARLYNYIFQETDKNYSIIFSLDGYDEISLTGNFKVMSRNKDLLLSPKDVGMSAYKEEDLFGGDSVEEAAQVFKNILLGKGTEAQESAVIINSAFAIQTICPEKTIEACIQEASDSLRQGKAAEKLRQAAGSSLKNF